MTHNIYYQVKWMTFSFRKCHKDFLSINEAEEFYKKVMRYPSMKHNRLVKWENGSPTIIKKYCYNWRG